MTKIWYLLLVLNGQPINYHMSFEEESDCEYVGKVFVNRILEKKLNYSVNYVCWNSQRPPTRKMGGAQ